MGIFFVLAAASTAAFVVHTVLRRTDSRSLTLEGPVRRLEVELPAGRVRVRAGRSGAVQVRRTLQYVGGTPPALSETQAGDVVRVAVAGGQAFAGYVSYEVEAPAHVDVWVRLGAGSVELDGVAGEVDARVSAGRIRAHRLLGPARLRVETGELKGRELFSSRVEARGELGSVDLAFGAEPEHVDAEMSAGSVVLRVPGGPYHVQSRADLGQSHVRVAQDPGARRTLRVRSGLGEVSIRPGAPAAFPSVALPLTTSLPSVHVPPDTHERAAVPHAIPQQSGPQQAGPQPTRSQQAAAPAEDPRIARVDALCERVLRSLREGPTLLREVVQRPEATVESLRRSCHALVHREAELRALWTEEDRRRLAREREALAARVASESDTVTREHLSEALSALDAQAEQRAALLTAAGRLEAEHTRLYYTLEGLHAQLLRLRSAGEAPSAEADAGLRRSLERLDAEVDAVAEALESLRRDSPEPIAEVGGARVDGAASPDAVRMRERG